MFPQLVSLHTYKHKLWKRWATPGLTAHLQFVAICLYPFLVTSLLIFHEYATWLAIGRLSQALIYNAAFFLIASTVFRLLEHRISRWMQRALLLFLAAFTFASVGHFLLYRQLLGLPSIYAIVDTTPAETFEFLTSTIRAHDFALAVLLTIPPVWAAVRFPPLPSLTVQRPTIALLGSIALLAACSMAGVLRPYFYMNNPVLLIGQTVRRAILEKQTLQKLYEAMPAPRPARASADRKPVTHVLVIGESTTSKHMSLFGYARTTTPVLDSLKPQLEIAADTCSSRTTTSAQLKELLTFATREDHEPLFKAPSLVQLMNSDGFKTYWLSNQQIVGPWDTWAAVFSKPAHVRTFTDRRGGFEGASYDGKLLPLLREALADASSDRFIVLHLMGTHVAYDLRYPREFAKFNDDRGVDPRVVQKGSWYTTRYNQYDNAVLYNDYVLGQIIDLVKGLERATLTYVSDHGETLGATSYTTGHWDGKMPRQGYEVPLLFYLTPSIKADLGKRLDIFRRNLGVPIQTDRLIHTLLDLYGVQDEEWRPERSLLRADYSPGPRHCDSQPE